MVEHPTSFLGNIGYTWRQSTPWWPKPSKPPNNSPNIVFIVLDDVGFSDIGCFGSEISTPNMDALAAGGLRYNNFHVTAMCSPTRACLLTGRNAHAVGMGIISEWAGGYPGYRGKLSHEATTIPEVLAHHSYASYAVGKWHLMNTDEYGAAGPHDGWPLGRGFSRWYGFHGALADQWNPELFQDNRAIEHHKTENYHLSTDLVNHAIDDIRDHLASAPHRPFFHYLAFGACHWPHHVPQEYIERYRGKYSKGWDAIRAERFAKQQTLGIIPPSTQLAPRNPGVLAWEQTDPEVRIVNERLQETYAAFMEHTDDQIGRLVCFLRDVGQLDDTLIVLISDNGASPEGGATGAINARRNLVYQKETTPEALARIDKIGGDKAFNHYATGWAQVSNTPLKWYKRGNHGGGIRAPLIIHWPLGIQSGGQIRSQFHHVIDLAPTIYQILEISAPTLHRGIKQLPIHGVSMAYTFNQADASTKKNTQIFEMLGDRAIWHKGWKGVVRHVKGQDFNKDNWELYDLQADFSECNDLAAKHSETIAQLSELWNKEAQHHKVLPLDDRETERLADRPKTAPRMRYELSSGMSRIDRHASPDITNCSYRIDAEYIQDPGKSVQGVILSYGSWFGGIVLYAKDGRLNFEYLYSDSLRHTLSFDLPSTVGLVKSAVKFVNTGKHQGLAQMIMCDKVVATLEIPRTWTVNILTCGMNCGRDGKAPVSDSYAAPFVFTGRNLRVVFELSSIDHTNTQRTFNSALKEQ